MNTRAMQVKEQKNKNKKKILTRAKGHVEVQEDD